MKLPVVLHQVGFMQQLIGPGRPIMIMLCVAYIVMVTSAAAAITMLASAACVQLLSSLNLCSRNRRFRNGYNLWNKLVPNCTRRKRACSRKVLYKIKKEVKIK